MKWRKISVKKILFHHLEERKHPIKSPLYDKLIIRTFAIKKDYEQKSTHGAESVYSDKQPPFDEWTHNKGILWAGGLFVKFLQLLAEEVQIE